MATLRRPNDKIEFIPRDQFVIETFQDEAGADGARQVQKKNPIKYIFRTPSMMDKALLKSALVERGWQEMNVYDRLGFMAREVKRVYPEEDQGWRLEAIEEFSETLRSNLAEALAARHHMVHAVADDLTEDSARFRKVEARQVAFPVRLAETACQMFLIGWTGFPKGAGAPVRDEAGRLTPETLEWISGDHAVELGTWLNHGYFGPTAAEAKNSGSPVPSDSSPKSSKTRARTGRPGRRARASASSSTLTA